ncbi:MAG TPA: HEAT repeat domain-containing protein [Acidimicrobiia bacterium]|nr:HEAT repeat domain-containing protein [Acidimicrobiia bacterium]
MNPLFDMALGWSAATTVLLAVTLAVVKLLHREAQRWRGVRTAHYVAAVGELVSRRMLPAKPPRAWGEDPLFHQALADYRHLVTGADRDHIGRLAHELGVFEVLLRRIGRHRRLGVRLRALGTLVDLAEERHRNVLRDLARDRNSHVRVNAIRGLARLEDLESIPWILDHASGSQPWEAARSADALVEMGRAALPGVCGWIEEQMPSPAASIEVVALAGRVLGLIGDPKAEPTLLAMLAGNRPNWRVAAASALERAGTSDSIPALVHALEDRAAPVRARVAVALGAMAEPAVARPVSTLLYDQSWWVRQNAATALGQIPGGTDYLLAALHGPDPYAADAALNQLTISGVLAGAVDRVLDGTASEQDGRIAALANVPA